MNKSSGFLVALGVIGLAGMAGAAPFKVDPAHSTVGFSVKHLGISTVRGVFTNFEGTIDYDAAKPEGSRAAGTIKVASIDTHVEARDKHLRSPDFFDAQKFPEIRYETVAARREGGDWVVTGQFTLHGVTKPIELRGTLAGPVKDPWGKTRISLSASGMINRQDYGVKWSQRLDNGGLVVGDEVKIELEIEAIAEEPARK